MNQRTCYKSWPDIDQHNAVHLDRVVTYCEPSEYRRNRTYENSRLRIRHVHSSLIERRQNSSSGGRQ